MPIHRIKTLTNLQQPRWEETADDEQEREINGMSHHWHDEDDEAVAGSGDEDEIAQVQRKAPKKRKTKKQAPAQMTAQEEQDLKDLEDMRKGLDIADNDVPAPVRKAPPKSKLGLKFQALKKECKEQAKFRAKQRAILEKHGMVPKRMRDDSVTEEELFGTGSPSPCASPCASAPGSPSLHL